MSNSATTHKAALSPEQLQVIRTNKVLPRKYAGDKVIETAHAEHWQNRPVCINHSDQFVTDCDG